MFLVLQLLFSKLLRIYLLEEVVSLSELPASQRLVFMKLLQLFPLTVSNFAKTAAGTTPSLDHYQALHYTER